MFQFGLQAKRQPASQRNFLQTFYNVCKPYTVAVLSFCKQIAFLCRSTFYIIPVYLDRTKGSTEEQPKVPLHGEQKGIGIVEAECDFIKYCRDNAAALSEHDWYAMISNLTSGRPATHT